MMYGETVERLKEGAYQLQDLKFIWQGKEEDKIVDILNEENASQL
jgi:hypothetical protein